MPWSGEGRTNVNCGQTSALTDGSESSHTGTKSNPLNGEGRYTVFGVRTQVGGYCRGGVTEGTLCSEYVHR